MTQKHTQVARAAASHALVSILCDGQSFNQVDFNSVKDTSRSLAKAWVYGVLRHYAHLDALLSTYLQKPIKAKEASVKMLLLIGLYQLEHLDIPENIVVNETVDATQALNKTWARGLINAVLRAYLRKEKEVKLSPSAKANHPKWLLRELQTDWPTHWQAVVDANQTHPPMWLRIHTPRITRADFLNALQKAEITFCEHPTLEEAVELTAPMEVHQIPGFSEGWFAVQDAAAQWAAKLLDLQPEQQVLDACAAPGGKTCHLLAEQPNIRLTAVDSDATRLTRVKDNLARMHGQAKLVCGDASAPKAWCAGQTFDRILLDAPCSATGVIRRHPDIKWLRQAGDISHLAKTQGELLEALWPYLKPGGRLLYATCSVLKKENQTVLADFIAQHADCSELSLDIPGALRQQPGYQILPGTQNMDGFYYVALQKNV